MQDTTDGVVLPLSLEWNLTDACNLNCRYCFDRHRPKYREVPWEGTLHAVIERAPKYVWLGGGEPTLVRDLPAIARELKDRINPHIGINTNLTRPDVAAALLPYVDDLIVSLDTMDRKVSRRFRGVDPAALLRSIAALSREAREKRYPVLLTVYSVVLRESLSTNGIAELSDALAAIDAGINHLLTPVYPREHPDSIIGDREYTDRLFALTEALKRKGRSVSLNFPETAGEKTFAAERLKCYRRYFRLRVETGGEPYSPCPEAPPGSAFCDQPCNCAEFIDRVLFAAEGTEVDDRMLRGRFTPAEEEVLRSFVKTYINPRLKGNEYSRLIRQT